MIKQEFKANDEYLCFDFLFLDSAVAKEPGLVEIPVLRVGIYNHPASGEADVTIEHLREMVAAFEADGGAARPIPFDYNHKMYDPDAPPEETKASGWIVGVKIRQIATPRYTGPALIAVTQFSDKAREEIKENEYKYVSAVFALKTKNEGVGKPTAKLRGAALTNTPFDETLPPIAFTREGIRTESKMSDNKFALRDSVIALLRAKGLEVEDKASDEMLDGMLRGALAIKAEGEEEPPPEELEGDDEEQEFKGEGKPPEPKAPPAPEAPAKPPATPPVEPAPVALTQQFQTMQTQLTQQGKTIKEQGDIIKNQGVTIGEYKTETHLQSLGEVLRVEGGGKLNKETHKHLHEQYKDVGADLKGLKALLGTMPILFIADDSDDINKYSHLGVPPKDKEKDDGTGMNLFERAKVLAKENKDNPDGGNVEHYYNLLERGEVQ